MTEYALELTRPFWLVTLTLLVVVLSFHVRSLSDFSLWQRRLSLAVRSLIVVLLAFAIAGLSLRTPTKQRTLLVAIDASKSVGEDAKERKEWSKDRLLAKGRLVPPRTGGRSGN